MLVSIAATEGFHSRQRESPWQGKSPWPALPGEMLPAPTAGLQPQLHEGFIHTHLMMKILHPRVWEAPPLSAGAPRLLGPPRQPGEPHVAADTQH